jgi:signal transduction histidine kinase
VLPYVLLAASASASLLQPDQTAQFRLGTLALVAVSAFWVLIFHTLRPATRRNGGPVALVYIVGLLVLCVLGMLRDPLFFIFTITGFAHSAMLRPTPMIFVGVWATAVVINTFPYRMPNPTHAQVLAWVAVIAVQTALIGTTNVLGRMLTEQNDHRRRTVRELETTLAENAGLHAQLVTQAREAGVHDERQRMAREIHDTLTQGLTGIITQLEAAGQAHASARTWRGHIDSALALAREGLAEARRSVHALHPEPLEAAHLPEVLETVVLRWSDNAGVAARFRTTGEPMRMVPDVEAALFRTAQEALANISKHARASRVDVTLSYTDDVVLLDVRDDGIGFDPVRVRSNGRALRHDGHGYGLGVMRQRMQRVAGSLQIESAPGKGTTVGATVPAISAAEAAPLATDALS